MNDLTPQEQDEHNRAEQARLIVENPLVVEALALMEQRCIDAWANEPLSVEEREEVRRFLLTTRRFIGMFEGYLQNGAAARHVLGLPVEVKSFHQRIKEFFHGKQKA